MKAYWMVDERSLLKRKDSAKVLAQLDFDLTHRCNKNCPDCNLRIKDSHFDRLTFGDYLYIKSCIADKDSIRGIKLTGGEALFNPQFEMIVRDMLESFTNASVMVHTNGLLLPAVKQDLFKRLNFRLSEYPGWNDAIVRRYQHAPNVYVYRWKGEFYDPNYDPDLTEQQAKLYRETCMFSTRIIGRRLYGCCLSYPVEAAGKCESVSVPFDSNWQQNWHTLETWKACQHCPIAR